jgi:hypothetical protein
MSKTTAPDPAVGVWKLNLVESSFRLLPAPMRIMRVQAWGNGLKVSADDVDAQGNAVHLETAYKFNGKDYPFKGSSFVDTISANHCQTYPFGVTIGEFV